MSQPTYPDLKSMRNVDIECFDRDTIPYTKDISINTEHSVLDRVLNYINQSKNPYFNRSGAILVKIEFSKTEKTFEDCFEGFLRSFY